MTEQTQQTTVAEIIPVPSTSKMARRVTCPHCDSKLPIDTVTECDTCGAHLRLLVKTDVPPVGVSGDD